MSFYLWDFSLSSANCHLYVSILKSNLKNPVSTVFHKCHAVEEISFPIPPALPWQLSTVRDSSQSTAAQGPAWKKRNGVGDRRYFWSLQDCYEVIIPESNDLVVQKWSLENTYHSQWKPTDGTFSIQMLLWPRYALHGHLSSLDLDPLLSKVGCMILALPPTHELRAVDRTNKIKTERTKVRWMQGGGMGAEIISFSVLTNWKYTHRNFLFRWGGC